MIQFQKCYTTYEQSKKLLELGLPADSADMFYDRDEVEIDENIGVYLISPYDSFKKFGIEFYLPCWSVGRLIEIFEICTGLRWQNDVIVGYSRIDMLLEDFESEKYYLDFSKLEES